MNSKSVFLDALNNYLNSYLVDQKGLSVNTQRSYKYTFKLLIEYMYNVENISSDKVRFSDLTYDVLQGFLSWLEENRKCSISTRNQRLAALKGFSIYSQIRYIDASTTYRNAVIQIDSKKFIPTEKSYFTYDEVKYLLESTEDTKIGRRNYALLSFMYATGARAQEVCDLKVGDVVFKSGRASVILHGKGNKSRRVTIASKPSKILMDYIESTQNVDNNSNYVFSSQLNSHMTIACIEEIFKKYIAIAKNAHPDNFKMNYSPHSMRHTTATHMIEAGVPILVIKNFLGHSSVETTQVYAKISAESFSRQIEKWNNEWLNEEKKNDGYAEGNIPSFLM